MKTFYFPILLLLYTLPIIAIGQEVKIYSGNNYHNLFATLQFGQSINFTPDGCNGSFEVLNGAVKIEMVYPPYPYPFLFLYSEQSVSNVESGTDQYCGQLLKITCLKKAANADELPQPTAWLPIDRTNVNDDIAVPLLRKGDTVILLKRAFIWENSEDLDCCDGPYGSVGIRIYKADLLRDYNFNFDAIAQNYCGSSNITDFVNHCTQDCYDNPSSPCCIFLHKYPVIYSGFNKLPGQIFNADNPCNDFGQCGYPIVTPDDPKSEWIDGPWGVCYSRIPVFNWTTSTTKDDEVSVVLREGDDTNCDDFLGGILINKNDINRTILFKAWKFGWLELEVKIINDEDLNYDADFTNDYWFSNWSGANPDKIHSIAQTPPYDQYLPYAGKTINEMQATFASKTLVGLMGDKFPVGKLSKPMRYKLACDSLPAVFGKFYGVELFSDPNYKGDSRFFVSDVPDLDIGNINFADVTSSVRIYNLTNVKLYDLSKFDEDYDENSRYLNVTEDIPDLRTLGWNDKVGSLKIIR